MKDNAIMPYRKNIYSHSRHNLLFVREGAEAYQTLSHPSAKNFGTFADSKTAPIHRWFQYPAGFSYKAVEYMLDLHGIRTGDLVYDPFVGTGTTALVSKQRGVESYGVEAHPFVCKIAKVKTIWDYDFKKLESLATQFTFQLQSTINQAAKINVAQVPELVRKCFSNFNLQKLLYIRDAIETALQGKYRDLFLVALTSTLRQASAAATGWPYIAPKKKIQERDGMEVFVKQLFGMINDLKTTPEGSRKTPSHIILGDARASSLPENSLDLSFTSPPYLNNYDYADRTRLETYFNRFASSWGDITEKVRTKLIVSATTQISRSDYNLTDIVIPELKLADPYIAREIQEKVNRLSDLRITKGGKKSYDIMVGQYFNDMTLVLMDNYKLLKPGACFVLILGDSAPYGVYIPTEEYLGRIGLGIGFKEHSIYKLRGRGEKWRGNPQRHHVALKESILTLRK